jgi:hypothetical protein
MKTVKGSTTTNQTVLTCNKESNFCQDQSINLRKRLPPVTCTQQFKGEETSSNSTGAGDPLSAQHKLHTNADAQVTLQLTKDTRQLQQMTY